MQRIGKLQPMMGREKKSTDPKLIEIDERISRQTKKSEDIVKETRKMKERKKDCRNSY